MRAFQTVNFIDNWHMDRAFLSLAVMKTYRYINIICVKNENCEFLQNSFTDFLVASSVGTAKHLYQ